MSEATQPAARSGPAAELLRRFVADSLELREGALLDGEGRQLYSTDGADWEAGAARLLEAAAAEEREIAYVHVGTEAGEVLLVRGAAGSAIVLSDRFPLASLVLSDLRAVLRALADEGPRKTG